MTVATKAELAAIEQRLEQRSADVGTGGRIDRRSVVLLDLPGWIADTRRLLALVGAMEVSQGDAVPVTGTALPAAITVPTPKVTQGRETRKRKKAVE